MTKINSPSLVLQAGAKVVGVHNTATAKKKKRNQVSRKKEYQQRVYEFFLETNSVIQGISGGPAKTTRCSIVELKQKAKKRVCEVSKSGQQSVFTEDRVTLRHRVVTDLLHNAIHRKQLPRNTVANYSFANSVILCGLFFYTGREEVHTREIPSFTVICCNNPKNFESTAAAATQHDTQIAACTVEQQPKCDSKRRRKVYRIPAPAAKPRRQSSSADLREY